MTDTALRHTITAALARFTAPSLLGPAVELFAALGYQSKRRFDVEPHGGHELIDALGLTGKLNAERALLEQWHAAELVFQLTADEVNASGQLPLFDTRQVEQTRIESYLFIVVDLLGASYTRTQLAMITREVNRYLPMPVFVLFRHGAALTFAVIDRRLHQRDANRDVLEKITLIKDIVFAQPHRAHVEILADLALSQLVHEHSVSNFVELHRAWRSVLDSSALNRRFYREIANWYFWAVERVEFPAGAQADRALRNATSLIRLITRLIFVWFLKEKGLVPGELFNPRVLRETLTSFGNDESSYYQAILQNLFFATLNQEMNTAQRPDNRKFRGAGRQHYNITNLYRYRALFRDPGAALQLFGSIPFLNGGLFECLDKPGADGSVMRIDGFSDRNDVPLDVPNELFFGAEHEVDLNASYGTRGKRYQATGLITILQRYKFTVAENTPIEEEVALDPELLGQVFENLLAAYNPETQTTARKQTGSFYTPRPIVNYMVDEALVAYLDEHVRQATRLSLALDANQLVSLNSRLRALLSYSEAAHGFSEDEVRHLIIAIDSLKILDPACGSGAFPMGVLQKLVHILGRLDPGNARWKERQIDRVRETMRSAERIDDADIRDRTIADLEQQIEAINEAFERNELDYGRKLFLIENCIYGVDIQPIAVQIAKLRCFIALIVDQRLDDSRTNRGIRPLPNLETKFVAANALIGIPRPAQLSLRDPALDQVEQRLREVRARHFSARTPKTKAKYREQDRELRSQLAGLLRRDGFSGDTAALLSAWDPYDQNAFAPFFDREWMFGMRDGFDIIIANPPYVRQEQISALKPYFKEAYAETYSGTADLFVYFFHQGINLLRNGGRLVYITNNKWLRAGYGENLRGFLAAQTVVEQLVDFGHSPIFDGADVFPAIVVLEKPTNGVPTNRQVCVADFPREALGGDALDVYISEHSRAVPQARLSRSTWSLANASIDDLMLKIRDAGEILSRFAGIKPLSGVKTGFNEAFLLDTVTKERIVREDMRSSKIIKPYLRGRDIKRWMPEWDDRWMITAYPDINITDYPSVLAHLEQYRKELSTRAGSQEWWHLQSGRQTMQIFEGANIFYQDLAFHSRFGIGQIGFIPEMTCFCLPSTDFWLLAVLNSPLMWAYMWRNVIHGKDEVLRLKNIYMEQLPIAPPTDATRAEVEPAVARLIAITQADQQARRELRQWLGNEFEITKLGRKLEAFEELDAAAFADEVAKRRPKGSTALSAAAQQALHTAHAEYATPLQARAHEALTLERRLAELVNAAYGLTPEDVELLWATAPPRMPVGRGDAIEDVRE
ncbi:Eco57I restriction-modification methylase domain-containing protein [Candidatus Chloroploca sp. M-50]|uniref:site-specific DNA-methyltransferase (adenine-specific) n=1 Tax=Candidatus Chloroploca mongolica TaxID=2528176 RepID=A0ABS4DE32_9CHLR|nr:N-6 DNA methylase [Candidatus Chloroploca mongolica]MBP1467705.1 Eco57I restriction-modification methylase domain-containing protein [Candidatus Chloroploca mongolica]